MKIICGLIIICLSGHSVVAQAPSPKDSIVPVSPKSVPDTDRGGDRVFIKVEHEPSFSGGNPAWLQFQRDSLVYPKKALRRGLEGHVLVVFVVETNGSITSLTATTDDDPVFQEAALDLMRKSPRWIPAIQNNWVVRCYKKFYLEFSLPDKK